MNKFNILFIGTIAIGIFMLPAVISTFTGSHDYIAPENVECQTCHQDIFEELENSKDDRVHASDGWHAKQTFDCDECHTVKDVGGATPGNGHAANTVDCGSCHNKTQFEESGASYFDWAHVWSEGTGLYYEYEMWYPQNCADCHTHWGTPPTEGMYIDDVYETIVNTSAPHNNFYENAKNDTELLGASESCVACHSHVDFTITAPLGKNMSYNPNSGLFNRQ